MNNTKVFNPKVSDNTQIGDILFLDFYQGTKGNIPIARSSFGKICLINKDIKKPFIEYGSTWECEVNVVDDKKLIITPLSQINSKAANSATLASKVEELKTKEWNYSTGKDRSKHVKSNIIY